MILCRAEQSRDLFYKIGEGQRLIQCLAVEGLLVGGAGSPIVIEESTFNEKVIDICGSFPRLSNDELKGMFSCAEVRDAYKLSLPTNHEPNIDKFYLAACELADKPLWQQRCWGPDESVDSIASEFRQEIADSLLTVGISPKREDQLKQVVNQFKKANPNGNTIQIELSSIGSQVVEMIESDGIERARPFLKSLWQAGYKNEAGWLEQRVFSAAVSDPSDFVQDREGTVTDGGIVSADIAMGASEQFNRLGLPTRYSAIHMIGSQQAYSTFDAEDLAAKIRELQIIEAVVCQSGNTRSFRDYTRAELGLIIPYVIPVLISIYDSSRSQDAYQIKALCELGKRFETLFTVMSKVPNSFAEILSPKVFQEWTSLTRVLQQFRGFFDSEQGKAASSLLTEYAELAAGDYKKSGINRLGRLHTALPELLANSERGWRVDEIFNKMQALSIDP